MNFASGHATARASMVRLKSTEEAGDTRTSLAAIREVRANLELSIKLLYVLGKDVAGNDVSRHVEPLFIGDDRDPKTILLERFTRIIERRQVADCDPAFDAIEG